MRVLHPCVRATAGGFAALLALLCCLVACFAGSIDRSIDYFIHSFIPYLTSSFFDGKYINNFLTRPTAFAELGRPVIAVATAAAPGKLEQE